MKECGPGVVAQACERHQVGQASAEQVVDPHAVAAALLFLLLRGVTDWPVRPRSRESIAERDAVSPPVPPPGGYDSAPCLASSS